MRKTISVLMRIVEQVYSAILLSSSSENNNNNNENQEDQILFNALARVPPSVLKQQTDQFVAAAWQCM